MPGHGTVEPTIPSDMWQTLIRIETACVRSETKIDGLADKIDGAVKRLDGHEERISIVEKTLGELAGQRAEQVKRFNTYCDKVDKLETWHSEVSGGTKGIGLGWKVGGAVASFVMGIGALLGIQSITPHKQVVESKATVERSISVPSQAAPR